MATIRRFCDELINAGDMSYIDEICAPEYVLEISGQPPIHLHEGVEQALAGLQTPSRTCGSPSTS